MKHCFEFIFEMIRSVSPLLMEVVKDALVFFWVSILRISAFISAAASLILS